jgi:hypothetical protein
MLESAKHRVLEVDTPGQQVPPLVRYKTTYLLIRDVVGSVPYSDEWEIDILTLLGSHDTRGDVVLHTTPENLSIAIVPCTTLAKPNIRPIVNLYKGML